MNIIESFLTQSLSPQPKTLVSVVEMRVQQSPFSNSLLDKTEALLDADVAILDELWKFSVVLDVPHQQLFDAFNLQMQLALQT